MRRLRSHDSNRVFNTLTMLVFQTLRIVDLDSTQLINLSHSWNTHHQRPRERSVAMHICVGWQILVHRSHALCNMSIPWLFTTIRSSLILSKQPETRFQTPLLFIAFQASTFRPEKPVLRSQSWGARQIVLSWNLSSACLSVQKKFGGRARGNEWNSSDDWYAKRDGKANVFPAHSCTTFVVTSQDLFLLPVGSSLLTSGFCLSLPPRVTDYRSSRDKHEAMKHMSFGLALKPLSWPRDVHNHYHMYANVWHHGTQSAYLFKLFKITQTVSCNTGHENTIINTSCHVSSSCLLDQLFSAIHNIAFGGAKRDWKTPFEENWGKAYILFVLGEILLVRQLSRSELVTSSAL